MDSKLNATTMSDTAIMMTVENLIAIAMGPSEENRVDFKMLQTILMILAQQTRVLEKTVMVTVENCEQLKEMAANRRKSVHDRNEKRLTRFDSQIESDVDATTRPRSRSRSRAKSIDERRSDSAGRSRSQSRISFAERDYSGRRRSTKSIGGSGHMDGMREDSAETDVYFGETSGKGQRKSIGMFGREDRDSDRASWGKYRQDSETGSSHSGGTRSRRRSKRAGSIEVVTRSEFDMLVDSVNNLKAMRGPVPRPSMPDNQDLLNDIKDGRASLSDTMGAMSMSSRIEASEEMVLRMANILNSLSAAGTLPENVMEMVAEANAEADLIASTAGKKSRSPRKLVDISVDHVSKNQLKEALASTKAQAMEVMVKACDKTLSEAESVEATAKKIREKMNVIENMDSNMKNMLEFVNEHVEFLNQTEIGIATETTNVKVEILQLHTDLQKALAEFRSSTANPETLAVNALTEKYNYLLNELERVKYEHMLEAQKNNGLCVNLENIRDAMSILQEGKAEHEEVLDMFKDKADKSMIKNMITQKEFAKVKVHLEEKLDNCYRKFKRHDDVWHAAVKDLKAELDLKAYFLQMLAQKDELLAILRDLEMKIHCIIQIVGEPKAAMITQKMSRNFYCGVCQGPAKMEIIEKSYGKPPKLPAQRAQSVGAENDDECKNMKVPFPRDHRSHYCHRWAGGSHTLLTAVAREQACRLERPVDCCRHYDGKGTDGQMYKLSAEYGPCAECNKSGAGDANLPAVLDNSLCTEKQ